MSCDEECDCQECRDMRLLDRHVASLMEHFDAAQVFVTRTDGRNTVTACSGAGNWHARRGTIEAFIRHKNHEEAFDIERRLMSEDGGEEE